MQDLRVIGVESGALLVAADDGTRYRIPIDEVMQAKLRQTVTDPGTGPKLSPREIQAHIRSGMSAQDVASITGAPLEYIQRFEGPVVAEREFVVQSALGIAVRMAGDDPMSGGKTFGTAIRERLLELGGINERWASWKDTTSGWIVKLSFTANQIDHDARWQFDPKRQSLAPLNNEAITLSQQGEAAGVLMPRLRAVTEQDPDSSRFDSGAFAMSDSKQITPEPVRVARAAPEQPVRIATATATASTPAPPAAIPAPAASNNQTADLLDALRRRRGERESANFDEAEARAVHPATGAVRIVEVSTDSFDDGDSQRSTAPQPGVRKKGRATMPSWDEIVFGARPDDDLA
jgi:hypothetical protein